MQHVTVLGSTGSIGTNTLDVVARHPDKFSVFALTAATQVDGLLKQIQRFSPKYAVMVDEDCAKLLAGRVAAEGLETQVLSGQAGLIAVSEDERTDSVMAAIVGAAGLMPCMAAARSGKKLMLANKEALVVGGACFMAAVQSGGGTLLPIDSEHSAIFQSLPENRDSWPQRVDKIVLTASGGPFRKRDIQTLSQVTPEEACAHPNWVMGKKISVDSATMMNKALEVIEAHYLFGVPPNQIEVVIHPQSVIHSMVQYVDGSVVAQLGTPDMRVPIAYGLSWPDRVASGAALLDFSKVPPLTFQAPDPQRFPGLALAWQALLAPAGTTAVLNAANEVAVDSFLKRRIRFDQIHMLNQNVMERCFPDNPRTEADLLEVDAHARRTAGEMLVSIAR